MKQSIGLIILGILAFFFTAAMPARAQFYVFLENDIVGKQAPDFTLTDLEGKEFNLTRERDGKKAVVFFWATWCPTCGGELKHLNESAGSFADQGIKIFAVNVGETSQPVSKYVAKNGLDKLSVILDEETELADPYGLIGVPSLYFIRDDGTVASLQHSLPEDILAEFDAAPSGDKGSVQSPSPDASFSNKKDILGVKKGRDIAANQKLSYDFLVFGAGVSLLIWMIFVPVVITSRLETIIKILENRNKKLD